MKNTSAKIILFCSSLIIVAGLSGAASAASPEKPCRPLGGVDLNSYCQKTKGGKAVLKQETPYGWQCETQTKSGPVGVGISMQDACKLQYGKNANAELQPDKANSPYGWRCMQCVK